LALPRARVRVRALSAHREPAPVAYTSIAPDVHESLHVHRYLAAQVTLDLELALDDVADPAHLVLAPGLHPLVRVHVGAIQDPARRRAPDPVDVRDRDLAPLLPRQIHARNSRHRRTPFFRARALPAPLSPGFYPCLALCRGFLQITRVTPRRLMILQCSHRALIDGLTFIVPSPSPSPVRAPAPPAQPLLGGGIGRGAKPPAELLEPVRDPAPREVVRRQLDLHPIARE